MKSSIPFALAPRLFLLALLAQACIATAAPVEHQGRGIFRFTSGSGCPLGAQAMSDCNRVALDQPQARAVIDADTHAIVFSSDEAQKSKEVFADVLLQGQGVSAAGQQVPLSVMLLLRREGSKWNVDSYPRAPVSGAFTQIKLDPYTIFVMENGKRRAIFTPAQAQRLFANPGYARRLARAFVGVRATDHKASGANDLTVVLGYGKLAKHVLRVNFEADAASPRQELNQVLSRGNWSIQIDALSSHIPDWAVRRELFLFGLEGQETLAPVEKNGLKSGDKLVFGSRQGKGYLQLNGREAAFDGASAAGRDFMRDSFMGLIMTWQRASVTDSAGGAARSQP